MTDTVTVRDTLRISVSPTAVSVREGRRVGVALSRGGSVSDSSLCVISEGEECVRAVLDSSGDSVRLPTSVKVYGDSNYRAVVSGVFPSLDSLTIYPRRNIVTVREPAPRVSPWGLGITAGLTATPHGLAPGITIGLTFRLK